MQEAARTLDLSRPLAILLMGVLGHITDDAAAASIVRRLLDAVPSGSYLVLSDGTSVVQGSPGEAAQEEQLARFFDGLGLAAPGLVSVTRWRPDPTDSELPPEVDALGRVGRKP